MSDNDSITNSNGIVGGWTHLIPEASFQDEESPAENLGPGHDGIEGFGETPGSFEKVAWSASTPETGDWTSPAEGVESGERPHHDPALPEVPIESIGPEDDGRESPTEKPHLSDEVAGSVAEEQWGDGGVPTEEALSEEGLQVCQESTSDGSAPSSPTVLSPSPSSHVPLISSQDSHAPLSQPTDPYTVTSPCSDNEGLLPVSSTPDIYSHISSAPENLGADGSAHDSYTLLSSAPEILGADGSAHDSYTLLTSAPEILDADSSAPDPYTHTNSAPDSLAPVLPASDVDTDLTTEPFAPVSFAPHADIDISPALEPHTLESQYSASVPSAPVLESQEGEELQKEEEVSEPAKILADVLPQEDFRGDSGPEAPLHEAAEGDGLRRRHAPPPDTPEPRARDEEEEEEEEEFHLVEKKEEGGWISLNKCIVGALVLLCLGSIIFTEEDAAPARDPELRGKQEWRKPDAKLPNQQEVSQLLGKLAQEHQQMAILQAQLQKENLDLVLQKTEGAGKEPPTGEAENHTSVHDSLLGQQEEAAVEEAHPGREGEKLGGGLGNGAREEVEQRRTERMENPGWREREMKRQWMGQVREMRKGGHEEKEWKKQRGESKEWRQREEGKEKKGGGDWKYGKDGEKGKHREWREKVEKRRAWETGREWYKGGEKQTEGAWKGKTERKDQRRDWWRGEKKGKDWKAPKEGWKSTRGWKEARGMPKDKSKKEKPWQQGPPEKKSRALDQVDYWKRQQEKLWKSHPPVACDGIAGCAAKEGLVPVPLTEFQALLGSYLEKLGDGAGEWKDAVTSLAGGFFANGVYQHHRVPFREFAEDVADVLEDLVEGDWRAEDEMEGFEREALRRFAVASGAEQEGKRRG